jgi:hypothetical protein
MSIIMGTNYFSLDVCRVEKTLRVLHIGEKSMGRTFLFHGYDEDNFKIKSFNDWKEYLLNGNVDIFDENWKKFDKNEFLKLILDSLSERRHDIEKHNGYWRDERGFLFTDHYLC